MVSDFILIRDLSFISKREARVLKEYRVNKEGYWYKTCIKIMKEFLQVLFKF